jgi:hypothetical protein
MEGEEENREFRENSEEGREGEFRREEKSRCS